MHPRGTSCVRNAAYRDFQTNLATMQSVFGQHDPMAGENRDTGS